MNEAASVSVLYVEDDETIAYLTKDYLILKGYSIELARDGISAFELFLHKKFQLCIIDIMLPEMDGWTLAKKIREIDVSVPILFLSAKSQVDDKIKGLSLGADDYITKPFSVEELVLRMEVFLKRSKTNETPSENLVHIGKLIIDFSNQWLMFEGKKTEMTRRESELLRYLIERSDCLVKREEILKEVWGDDNYFLGRSLDVFISRLRKLLAYEPAIRIDNVHGVGFRLSTGSKN
jgi:DNA-binding response OmpR family regulator